MAQASTGARPRPMSPHTTIWRWHITMLTSILNRVTGAASYGGLFLLGIWALCLASGKAVYGEFLAVAGSLPGKAVLFGLTVAVFYHLAGGVRHLAWDMGKGFAPKTANATSWLVIAFAIVASVALWAAAAAVGAL